MGVSKEPEHSGLSSEMLSVFVGLEGACEMMADVLVRLAYIRDRLERIEADALLLTDVEVGCADPVGTSDLILGNAREALEAI